MTATPFDPEALIDAMAPLLGLTLTPESRAQTVVHLKIAAEQAALLLAQPIGRRRGAGAGVRRRDAGLLDGPAQAIAAAVRSGRASAREVTLAALARIEARNAALGAFTDVTTARALARADAIDAARARGDALGPLAGAPFAVKNLFDVEGLPTRAGSKINRDRPPAEKDATLVARLEQPARSSSARSTWANTPTTSPARTRTTARPAIRMISPT